MERPLSRGISLFIEGFIFVQVVSFLWYPVKSPRWRKKGINLTTKIINEGKLFQRFWQRNTLASPSKQDPRVWLKEAYSSRRSSFKTWSFESSERFLRGLDFLCLIWFKCNALVCGPRKTIVSTVPTRGTKESFRCSGNERGDNSER